MKNLLIGVFTLSMLAVCASPVQKSDTPPGKNLIAGKSLHYEQPPTYGLTRSASDHKDLTDGKFRNADIWFYKDSCGWFGASVIAINIDLGKTASVGNVRIHLAQGHGGVRYPDKMLLMAGHSPDRMVKICDMIALNKNAIPPYEKGRFRSWIDSSRGHKNFKARYLKLIVFPSREGNLFFMTDELEVVEGSSNAPSLYTGGAFKGTTGDYLKYLRVSERLEKDLEFLKKNLSISKGKYDLNGLKKKLLAVPAKLNIFPGKKDTDFPINEAQVELAKVNQQLMAANNMKSVILWSSNRWEIFNSFSYPQDDVSCREVKMSSGEVRNLPLNFTNADPEKKNVAFTVESPFPVKVMRAFSAADSNNFFNSNRLEHQAVSGGKYRMSILPGESIQYFFRTTIPADTKPGDYTVKVSVDNGATQNFRIKIGHLKFPVELTTQYGTWDYINALGCHGQPLNKKNLPAAMALIREYQMNVTWGHEIAMPVAKPDMFDNSDNLVKPLDFSKFDAWVKGMPGFKRYFLFGGSGVRIRLNVGFDAVKNNARFQKRMTAYFNSLLKHIEEDLNLDPEIFAFHFLDEVHSANGKIELRAWCDSIHNAASPNGKKIKSFGNPFFDEDEFYSYPEIDVFQPSNSACNRRVIDRFMQVAASRSKDSEFGMYSCLGDARELDPYLYYAGTYRLGFLFNNYIGSSFWNLGSAPNGNISEYEYTGRYYSPWYFKGDRIFGSRQYEAIWEGRSDYEYLALLKKVNNALIDIKSPLADTSKKMSADIQKLLLDELNGPKDKLRKTLWTCKKDRKAADVVTMQIWDLMEKVAASHPEILRNLGWMK